MLLAKFVINPLLNKNLLMKYQSMIDKDIFINFINLKSKKIKTEIDR